MEPFEFANNDMARDVLDLVRAEPALTERSDDEAGFEALTRVAGPTVVAVPPTPVAV